MSAREELETLGWKTEGPTGNLLVKKFGDFKYTLGFREQHVVLLVSGPNGLAVSATVPLEEVQFVSRDSSPILMVNDYKATLALPSTERFEK